MKRNIIGGLIVACVGGALLAISGVNVVLARSYTSDIPQEFCDFTGCRPIQDIAMDSAIRFGIVGAIITAMGLFFFVYGMKHQNPPNNAPAEAR